jgi:hypothetical protein
MRPRPTASVRISIALCCTVFALACGHGAARRSPGSDMALPPSGRESLLGALLRQCAAATGPRVGADTSRAAGCAAVARGDSAPGQTDLIGQPPRKQP